MPRFSAFTPFGHLAFSGKTSVGERIYRDMLLNSGSNENLAEDGNYQDKLYADAMTMATAHLCQVRAGNQWHPSKSQELLPTLEYEHGLEPGPDASKTSRRKELLAVKGIRLGGKLGDVTQSLIDLLGADFVGYRPVRNSEVYAEGDGVFGVGSLLIDPMTPTRVMKFVHHMVRGGTKNLTTIAYVAGDDTRPYQVGQRLLVDPGTERAEVIVVEGINDDGTEIDAFFSNPHDAGSLITSQIYPLRWSDKRRHVVMLKAEAAADPIRRNKVHLLLKRQLKGTAMWHIVGENTPGSAASGPFKVGVSGLGVTTIGEFSP